MASTTLPETLSSSSSLAAQAGGLAAAASPSRARNPALVKLALKVLAIGAAIGLLALTFRTVDLREVGALVQHVGWWLPLLLVPHVAFLALETIGWRQLFAPLGLRPRYFPLLRVRFIAEAIGRTVPGGALWCETIKPILLHRHCDVPMADGIASVAARKYSVFLSHSGYLMLSLVVAAGAFTHASRALGLGYGLTWGLALIAIALFVASQSMVLTLRHGAVSERLFRLLMKLPVVGARVAGSRGGFLRTDARVACVLAMKPAALLKASSWFLLSWLCEALETYLMLMLLGVNITWSEALALEVVVAFGRHVFVFMPGGIGIQDVGYVAFLSAFGVPDALTLGAAFALLKRGKDLFWSAIGFAMLSYDGRATALPGAIATPERKEATAVEAAVAPGV